MFLWKKGEGLKEEKLAMYQTYHYLSTVKKLCLEGYCLSEKVEKEIFSYDPIPRMYQGCIPASEVGNAWIL